MFDKEAVTLAGAKFDVVHLAPAEFGCERRSGVEIRTYAPPAGLFGRMLQLRALYRKASAIDADCYHCNEMDSWLVGVLLKLLRGKRLVFDVHEHYPSTFAESRFPVWLRPIMMLLVKVWIRVQVCFTDSVVLAKGSVGEDYQSARSKVLVQNFTPVQQMRTNGAAATRSGRMWAVHLGLISKVRGWPQMLDALERSETDIGLWIIGTFNDGSGREFEERVREMGIGHRIRVEGWLPFDRVMERLLVADMGLVLFQPGIRNHVMASPHKIFDYMQAGLPVIAPDFATEVAAVVQDSGCGVLVNPADPGEIARALDRIAGNPAERERMGRAGRLAVEEKYNWEAEGIKLVRLYQEMSGRLSHANSR